MTDPRPRSGPIHWIDVDVGRLEANARAVAARAGGRRVMAVVKSGAYGHGAVQAARAFAAGGVAAFSVFLVDEGLELRDGGIREPILVMGPLPPGRASDALDGGLTPSVHSPEIADVLAAEARRRGGPVPYHLKVDTGMGRLGIPARDLPAFLERLQGLDGLEMAGIFSHLACAEDTDHALDGIQRRDFEQALAAVRDAGHRPSRVHLANSAALMRETPDPCDTVRPGLILYGLSPAPETLEVRDVRPALSFRARIAQVKTLPPGATAGYGATWAARRPTRLATLPVGYAEGVRRELQDGGRVLLSGRPAPVVGRVSMDLITVDVTDVGDVAPGDPVTLLGEDGDERIDVAEWARLSGTIPWDILCGIPARIPRRYLRDGNVVETAP